MKTLLFLIIPFLGFAQYTETERIDLQLIESNTSLLSTEGYKDAKKISNALLKKYPNDSLILVTTVRLYDAYVTKSKCSKYLTPKDGNLCNDALIFYDEVSATINYPRIALAQARVYYNLANYENQPEAKPKASIYFKKAIDSGEFSDFEIDRIKRYLNEL